MITEEPRKASEVLLDLEKKVDDLTAIIKLYDFNIKAILGKVNQTFSVISQLMSQFNLTDEQKSKIQQQLDPLRHPEAVDIPKGVPIKVATEFPGQRRVEPRGIVQMANALPQLPVPKKEEVANISEPTRKVPITQRIQDGDRRDIFMADVSILSTNKEVMAKLKTNALGKWNTQLSPGKYIIQVVKTDPTTKRKFGNSQEITVNNSETTINLPTFVLDRSKNAL